VRLTRTQRLDVLTSRVHRTLFFFASPSNLDIWTETVRCVVLHSSRPTLLYPNTPNPRTQLHSHLRGCPSRGSIHAIDMPCTQLINFLLINRTRTLIVWPRLLFQLPLEMARHVLYGPAPKRSTNGIWYVYYHRARLLLPSLLIVPCRTVYRVRQNLISSHPRFLQSWAKRKGLPTIFTATLQH
jgi:hypothetical protein